MLNRIKDLHDACKVVSALKAQLIEELPHYGHNALYLNNDEISTGLLNNKTEIKIHLLTGRLLYFHDEQGYSCDLIHEGDIFNKLQYIVTNFGLKLPESAASLADLNIDDLSYYLEFATKARRCLELFRMKLSGNFTQLHLWPHGFDFSVEWFPKKNEEQIGIGISPGDDQYESPYLYVNPYPFKEKMIGQTLSIGVWHTGKWNGIKVEWNDLENKTEQEISMDIFDLFLIAERNFKD